jgi:hypothetical protein
MAVVQLLERANSQELAVDPESVELNVRVGERLRVESMTILWRDLRVGEAEVAFQQAAHIPGSGVCDRDVNLRHAMTVAADH